MRRGGSLFKTKIAPLQTQTLIETKISHIKMLKLSLLDDCAINEKCYSVDGGRGICPLFSSPARGIWQLKSPRPWEFAIQGKKKMLISVPFPIILLLILCKVKVKHHSLVESFSLPFCLVLCTIFIYNDVCLSIIIPPWSLEWCQAKYKRISLPSLFKVIVISVI